MPDSTPERRPARRPTEGFTTARLPDHPGRPARLFLPADYQPKYAYPLVVLFHDAGTDEDAAARLAARLSRRNYVAVCPRGSVPLPPAAGRRGYAWGDPATEYRYVQALIARARAAYHVHPGRVHLVGVGSGATVAHRLAAPTAAAGVALLNGPPPARRVRPAARVFVGHGASHPAVPVAAARRAARVLAAAGAGVRFRAYPSAGLHEDMLRDVNRWLMEAVSPDHDAQLDG